MHTSLAIELMAGRAGRLIEQGISLIHIEVRCMINPREMSVELNRGLGIFNLDYWKILILLAILFSFFSAWKDYRKKIKKAEGKEELRQADISFLLKIFLLILAFAVFIF